MIKVRQIKVAIKDSQDEEILKKIAKKLNVETKEILNFEIKKQAIDARDKENILYVYEVDVEVLKEQEVLKRNKSNDVLKWVEESYKSPNCGSENLQGRVVIVGSGPAGLFAAYNLAEAGFKPLIIERGEKIENRVKIVENFWQTGILNEECNVQFGEGGAGTFSDGKLNTLVKDKRNIGKRVFDIFIKCGAPKEIAYVYNPHIGTDILKEVVINLRNEIIKMGGEFLYNTKLTDLVIENGNLTKIIVNNKEEIVTNALILAIGHSARDTFKMLYEKKLEMQSKPFAVGIRIMHNEEDINKAQWGNNYKLLPNASYKVTAQTSDNRGIYSFCMCPGGYVVNASSEKNRLAINGMSNYKRDSGISNSALIVTITPDDYGNNVLDGIEFQRKLETNVYQACLGKIPLQLWKDFKENRKSVKFGNILPKIKGSYEFYNLREILPDFMVNALLEAMPKFDKKIAGFAQDDAILAAIESRTSSPVRIIRDDNMEASIKGIYPCGEGAGYAGGITTSGMDGIIVSESIIKKFNLK